MPFTEVSHPPSFNMHLGQGILSTRLRSNTFDLDDIEPSNSITESDLSWLLAGLSEERNISMGQLSLDCSSLSDAASDKKVDVVKKSL